MPTVLAQEVPKFQSQLILDTNNAVAAIARAPHAIQVGPVPVGTTVLVQGKVHADADWLTLYTITDDADGQMLTFPVRFNFMQAIRSAGADEVVAYAQGG